MPAQVQQQGQTCAIRPVQIVQPQHERVCRSQCVYETCRRPKDLQLGLLTCHAARKIAEVWNDIRASSGQRVRFGPQAPDGASASIAAKSSANGKNGTAVY